MKSASTCVSHLSWVSLGHVAWWVLCKPKVPNRFFKDFQLISKLILYYTKTGFFFLQAKSTKSFSWIKLPSLTKTGKHFFSLQAYSCIDLEWVLLVISHGADMSIN